MLKAFITFWVMVLLTPLTAKAQPTLLYEVIRSEVSFTSEAPKELITASTQSLLGIVDPDKKTFLFKVPVISFRGFNTPLQREHFNENYMESRQHPEAEFRGKIIEDADIRKDGRYTLRAKGTLTIHGVSQPCIIRVNMTVGPKEITVTADFPVSLADYQIKIPRIVNDKLNPQVLVKVDAILQRKTVKR